MPKLTNEQWRSFSAHLDDALLLPESEVEKWLDALAPIEPEIAAELRRTLDARHRDGFAVFLSGSINIDAGEQETSLTGCQVGQYTIESEIGRGGMGSVWRAHRTDGRFEGTVAIKFVHAYWFGRRAAEDRFLEEGRLLGRLNHPNIARLLDAGVYGNSMPYLVLEYVEGEAIDAHCQRAGLDVTSCVSLFRSVLEAVGHAHSQLIIHRDLKPSNILVTRSGVVKLLDFGVAKLLREENDPTQTVSPALTPQYASPEQIQGKPVTTATDVYALGLVLYRLLTGEHCIQIEGRSTADICHAVAEVSPSRASLVPGLMPSRRRALEGDLDNILDRALRKDPLERYASVGALAEDLRRFLAHEPVTARAVTVPYRLTKFVRRNRGSVLSGALIALGLVGTSAVALIQTREARDQRDLALEQALNAGAQADLTQYILDDRLSQLTPQAEHERLDRARHFIGARFHAQPGVAAQLLIGLSARYIDQGDFTTAADVMVEAEGIGRRLDDAGVLGEIACLRSQDLAIARDYAAARAQLAAGTVQMRRLHPVPWQVETECTTAEAFVQQADGNFQQPVDHLRETLSHLESQGLHGSDPYFSIANNLADAYLQAGHYREAFEVSTANVELVRQLGRADTFTSAMYATYVCVALRGGGQPRRAVEYLDAETVRMRDAGGDDSMASATVGCRGSALLDLGQVAAAEPAIRMAMQKAEEGAQTYIASQYRALAVVAAIARGDLDSAETLWQPLAKDESQRMADGQKGTEIVRLLLVQAQLYLARQRAQDALDALTHANDIVQARNQPSNPEAFELEKWWSRALMAKTNFAEAQRHAQQAIELARAGAIDPGSSYRVGEALLLRAQVEEALGATPKASAREALTHLTDNLGAGHPLIAEARRLASLPDH